MMRAFGLLFILACGHLLNAAETADKSAKKAAETYVSHMVLEKRTLHRETFANPLSDAVWNAKEFGTWAQVDGRLDGTERGKDHHTAVAYLNVGSLPAFCVIRFHFRLGEAREVAVMGQGANGDQQRPTFMVAADPNGFGLVVMPDRTVKPAEPVPTCFPRVSQALDATTWYLMTLEIAGDEALAYTDDQHVSYARHLAFLKPRWGISLRATGVDQPASFDDVALSAGVIDPHWNQLRHGFEEMAEKQPRQ